MLRKPFNSPTELSCEQLPLLTPLGPLSKSSRTQGVSGDHRRRAAMKGCTPQAPHPQRKTKQKTRKHTKTTTYTIRSIHILCRKCKYVYTYAVINYVRTYIQSNPANTYISTWISEDSWIVSIHSSFPNSCNTIESILDSKYL